MIGLDTSAIIDLFRGEDDLRAFLESHTEPFVATIMSYLELFFGLDLEQTKHTQEAQYYREFFTQVPLLDLTQASCEKTAEISRHLKKEGKMIETFDCIIAAILLTNGIDKILTRNAKHFERIKGLRVISY